MPKELYNQTLISTPSEPSEDDRIALGQPGVSGAKNIKWSYFKSLIASVIELFSEFLKLSSPSTETVTGIPVNQKEANEEFASNDAYILGDLKKKQRVNPSWDAQTTPTIDNLIIDEVGLTVTLQTINGAIISTANPVKYYLDNDDGSSTAYQLTAPTVWSYTEDKGIWWLYIDKDGVKSTLNQSIEFGKVAPLLRFYYSTTEAKINTRLAEFHPNTMSAIEHERAHAQGAIWMYGGDFFDNILAVGSPDADGRNSVVAMETIINADDSFKYQIENTQTPTNWGQDLGELEVTSLNATNSAIFPYTYNQADGELRAVDGTRFPFPWDAATNRPQIINENGVFSEVSNGDFFNVFIYAIQDYEYGQAVRFRTSTEEFTTIADARDYSWETLKGFSPTLSDGEVRVLLKLIIEVRTNYSADCKYAVIREKQYLREQPVTTTSASSTTVTSSNVLLSTVPIGSTASNQDELNIENAANNVTQQEQTLSVVSDNIELDYNSKKQLLGVNLLPVSSDATITRANATNAQRDNFWIDITNLSTITFPTGTYMQTFEVDAGRWDDAARTFTPLANGVYEFVETKVGANYYLKVSDVNIGS